MGRVAWAVVLLLAGGAGLAACGGGGGPSGPECRTGCPCGRSCISCRDRCSMAAPVIVGDEVDAGPVDAR